MSVVPDYAGARANSVHLIAGQVVAVGCSAINAVIIARYLGANGLGVLSFAISVVGIVAPLAVVIFDAIVSRQLLSGARPGSVMASALVVRLAAALLGIALIQLLAPWVTDDGPTRAALGVISLTLLFRPAGLIRIFYLTLLKSKYTIVLQIAATLIGLLIRIGLVLAGYELIWFAAAMVVESALLAAFWTVLAARQYRPKLRDFHIDVPLAKRMLLDSLPLILSQVAVVLNLKIDQILIGRMLDFEAVGQYAAAARLSEIWFFIPAAISASFFPHVMRAVRSGKDAERLTRRLMRALLLVALCLAAAVHLLADRIIDLMYGADFSLAADVLRIHVWSAIFVFISFPVSKLMLARDALYGRLAARVAGIAINVIGNLVLIPKYGIVGAAWATLVSYAVGWVLFYAVLPSTRVYFRLMLSGFDWRERG